MVKKIFIEIRLLNLFKGYLKIIKICMEKFNKRILNKLKIMRFL